MARFDGDIRTVDIAMSEDEFRDLLGRLDRERVGDFFGGDS